MSFFIILFFCFLSNIHLILNISAGVNLTHVFWFVSLPWQESIQLFPKCNSCTEFNTDVVTSMVCLQMAISLQEVLLPVGVTEEWIQPPNCHLK